MTSLTYVPQFIIGYWLYGYVEGHRGGRTGEDVDINIIVTCAGCREEDGAECPVDLIERGEKAVKKMEVMAVTCITGQKLTTVPSKC